MLPALRSSPNWRARALLSLLLCLTLAACATRPLSEAETAFLATTHGAGFDADRMRLTKGALVGNITLTRPARPQVACRERIYPPEEGEVSGHVAGMVLFNRLMLARRIYSDDYLKGYPETLALPRAMFLAHEATHVWQWQQRATTGYAPWRAAGEHVVAVDPYLFEVEEGVDFLDFAYEQQASLMEEYVCCRALDPGGARTARLRAMLRPYFPDLAKLEAAQWVGLPWKGAETEGICS